LIENSRKNRFSPKTGRWLGHCSVRQKKGGFMDCRSLYFIGFTMSLLAGVLGGLTGCQAVDFSGGQQAAAEVAVTPAPSPLSLMGLGEVEAFIPPAELIRQNVLLTNGFVLRKVSYKNPQSESVLLQVEGDGEFNFETKSSFSLIPNRIVYSVNSIKLVLDRVEILSGTQVLKTISGGTTDSIEVASGQEVEIRWLLHAAPGTVLCVPDIFGAPVEAMAPYSAFLAGNIRRAIKLSRISGSDEMVLSDDSEVVGVGSPNWGVLANEYQSRCQGLMRVEFFKSPGWSAAGGLSS
jgi:hypothetical protein